jgi:hypothetical protein
MKARKMCIDKLLWTVDGPAANINLSLVRSNHGG